MAKLFLELSNDELAKEAFDAAKIGVDYTLAKACADILIKRAEAQEWFRIREMEKPV